MDLDKSFTRIKADCINNQRSSSSVGCRGAFVIVGGGGSSGSPNTLHFTEGINGETAGLFGAITNVPEPSTWMMMLAGLGGLDLVARRRRRSTLAVG
jgi:hypothetical protein